MGCVANSNATSKTSKQRLTLTVTKDLLCGCGSLRSVAKIQKMICQLPVADIVGKNHMILNQVHPKQFRTQASEWIDKFSNLRL
jgi:hypothetical protein